MNGWTVVLVAAATALPACASAPPAAEPLKPYRVVFLPVEGAATALQSKGGEDDVPLALTPAELENRIRESVRNSRVFSDVYVARPEELKGKGVDDEMQAASALAVRQRADLILRIEVKSARMTDLGNNGATFLSSLEWFMIPAPLWFVDDRTYDTDIAVQASLYDPADPVKPTASVVASSGRQELDLWDRGLSWYVPVVPPPFLKGSAQSVSETLTDRAMKEVLDALVLELRTREIPSRFEMTVVEAGPVVTISVASRRRLRSLDVEIDGRLAKTWAETGLVEDGASTPERFVYTKSVEIVARPGMPVRVMAEDEAGGREVRTVVVAGPKQ